MGPGSVEKRKYFTFWRRTSSKLNIINDSFLNLQIIVSHPEILQFQMDVASPESIQVGHH
jgi:hypothetical protein